MSKKNYYQTSAGKIDGEYKPSLILALDISTSCIGVSIVYDDGINSPNIVEITHVSPRVPKNVTGTEALIKRKEIFENEFLTRLVDSGITECVIEAPIMHAQTNSNYLTICELLQFNGLLSESIYRVLGIIPDYVTTYMARTYSFPELLSVRKFKKDGTTNDIKSVKKNLEGNNLVLFGSFPFDCDKKSIMMGCVDTHYPEINWSTTVSGEIKKQNYDACDSLVCAIAYINKKRHGEIDAVVNGYTVTETEDSFIVNYSYTVWGTVYEKTLTVFKC